MAEQSIESSGQALPAEELVIGEEEVIKIVDMHKWYGQFHVLKNINLLVRKGERIVICGPSGSGKSTLIRCINRLEEHQRGQIMVEGTELTGDLKHIELIRQPSSPATSSTSSSFAEKWVWCFSTSISSRI
jgi:general L-amino acid transport system ATP-binding protein